MVWPALAGCRLHPGCGCSQPSGTLWCDYLREKTERKHLKYISCHEMALGVGGETQSTKVEQCDVISTAAKAVWNWTRRKK